MDSFCSSLLNINHLLGISCSMTHRKHTHILEPEKLGFNFWFDHLLAKWFRVRYLISLNISLSSRKKLKI